MTTDARLKRGGAIDDAVRGVLEQSRKPLKTSEVELLLASSGRTHTSATVRQALGRVARDVSENSWPRWSLPGKVEP